VYEVLTCYPQDPDAPSITLGDGTVVHSDMVVGADGVHSVAIEAVLGRPHPPVPSRDPYNFCYRFLIPAEDIEADPETRFWNEEDDGRIKFFVKEKRRLVSYPCRKYVCFLPSVRFIHARNSDNLAAMRCTTLSRSFMSKTFQT
jgi:2-polyprenyl-6-methoxyphenol hydroxylase-like FAD-dependent oxidoreductase